MFTMLNRIGTTVLLLFATATSNAQNTTIDQYIQEAFANNNGLRQRNINADKAVLALQEARSYYLPAISLNTNYTLAGGGRTIDLPIGDLMNPVYATLNQLTASNRFPQIENQSVLLNPNNFYDAKFRTTQPLINMEIVYNKRIKQQAITKEQAAVNVYKRELLKDIKTAYYHCFQAEKAIIIYEQALKLVDENIRVNESLLRNGVTNATALTRAQTEKQKVESLIAEATNKSKNAKSYFNFLLNRDLDASISIDTTNLSSTLDVLAETESALGNEREELLELKSVKAMQELNFDLQRNFIVPKLNSFLDLGAQDFNFRMNDKSLYYFFGLSLQWDLFSGGKNTYKIKQAKQDVQAIDAMYDETKKAFELQEKQVKNGLSTAISKYYNAQKQSSFANKYYNDQYKVYKEGRLLYIELVDAQNQLTTAQLQLAIAESEILIAQAELERTQATYPLH